MLPLPAAGRAGFAGAILAAACASIPAQAATAPDATTAAPTDVTQTGARLNGVVDPNGARTSASFEFGTTTAYGSSYTAAQSPLHQHSGSTPIHATVSGLACGTVYHYRVRASNRIGARTGVDQTFNTAACSEPPPPPPPVAPTASTAAATGITSGTATLNGSAAAGSATATLSFEYGTTTAYGSGAAATPPSLAANASAAMSAALSGLACGTTYHFRARAASSVGTAYGANQTFATAACAPPPPPPPTACSSTTVHCVDVVAGANQEFTTIQAAANIASPGDTILVFDGSYAGFVLSRSGTASAPITVKANGAGAVIDRVNSAGEGIRVNNASHVVIEGFTVVGMPAFGLTARGATATSPMRNVVFRDNTVRDSGSTNIYASQVADSLIEGNVATGSGASHGIYLANAGADNTTVRGNLCHGNAANGIHVNGDASVGGDGIVSGAVIEGNVIHSNAANGINLDGLQASTLRNNVVYGNARHAIRGYRIDAAAGPRDLVIVNNTLVVASGNTPVKLTEDGGGHTIFNNVLVNEGSSGGSIVVSNAALSSNHNTFVNPGFSVNGGSSMLTLTQWRAQAGAYDAASQASTPAELFAAPAARDYRLRDGSTAANAGVATFNGRGAPAEDVAGSARPQGGAHDQGAFESF